MTASMLEGQMCPSLRKEGPDLSVPGLQRGLRAKPAILPGVRVGGRGGGGSLPRLTPTESKPGFQWIWGHRPYKVTGSMMI